MQLYQGLTAVLPRGSSHVTLKHLPFARNLLQPAHMAIHLQHQPVGCVSTVSGRGTMRLVLSRVHAVFACEMSGQSATQSAID